MQNNRAIIAIEGIRDRLQVLLVSGEPHPGERTWRNLLKADASVDLVHFTILRPPEKQDGTPIKELSLIAFPTRELFVEKLSEFDLDHLRPLPAPRHSADPSISTMSPIMCRRAAPCSIAAGPDYASRRASINATERRSARGSDRRDHGPAFRACRHRGRQTTSGDPRPAGQRATPPKWGRWFRLVDAAPSATGDIVMAGPDNKPLLLLSRYGEGRVALMLSDQGWLWARGFDGGGPQTELLRRLAHWLMKEPELEEEALSGTQEGRNLVIERRTMADEAQPVTVTMPSGRKAAVPLAQVSPGIWRGTITSTENGIHRLNDDKLSVVAALGEAGTKELEELTATDSKLAPLIAETRGGAYWLGHGQAAAVPRVTKVAKGRAFAGSSWLGLQANGAYRVRAVSELPLFGTLLGLALLLGLASLTWFREGR